MSEERMTAERNPLVIDVGEGRDFMGLGTRVHRLIHPNTTGSDQVGVSIAMHGPGDRVKRHRHPYEEAYYVIKGEGVMFMEGRKDIELTVDRQSLLLEAQGLYQRMSARTLSLNTWV